VRFFANPRLSAASLAITLAFFGLFGFIFLYTQYLQFIRGMSPLQAGLRLAPPAIGLAAGAPLAPRVVERIGTKVVVTTGLVLAGFATLLLSRAGVEASEWGRTGSLVLFGFGMGLTIAPATDSIMGAVPRQRAGVGSAVNDTTRQTGGALGVAVIGSIFATRYDRGLGAVRAHLPPSAWRLVKQSVGAALAIAHRAGPRGGPVLAHQVRTSFVRGFTLATALGSVMVFLAALVTGAFLPAEARPPSRGRGGAGPARGR
jgi:predicted MFS family arabinose efflux permease